MEVDKTEREAAARERRRLRMAALASDIAETKAAEPEWLADTYTPSDEFVPRFLRESWSKLNGR